MEATTPLIISRPDEPPAIDARFAEPPPNHRRTQVITGCLAAGLAIGLLWTLLTVPEPNCGPGPSMCELQRIHAAQLTKLALAALAGFAVGCALTRDLRRHPGGHPRQSVDLPTPMDPGTVLSAMRARPRPHR